MPDTYILTEERLTKIGDRIVMIVMSDPKFAPQSLRASPCKKKVLGTPFQLMKSRDV